MRRPIAAWSLFWAGFAVLDLAADRRGASLCTAVRHIFPGRRSLLATYTVGAVVLGVHLGKRPTT